MAISQTVDLLTTALWPQGDIRDPLGVWGARQGVTGDASAGGIKVIFQAPAGLGAAYIYTCYSINIAKLTGAANSINAKVRLLTNWPNIDSLVGVQAYGSLSVFNTNGSANFTSPVTGAFDHQPISPADRFLLLFDPRPGAGDLAIVEIEYAENVNTDTYSFEAYGYFWDRSVLNAPGGPRHPGAS